MWVVFVKRLGSLGVIDITEVIVVVVVIIIVIIIIMSVVTPRSPSRAHKDLSVRPRVREVWFLELREF